MGKSNARSRGRAQKKRGHRLTVRVSGGEVGWGW